MNVLDYLTEDIETYLDKALAGYAKPVQVSILDFTRGETEITTILSIDTALVVDQKEALIILINRLLNVREEWSGFSMYTKKDILYHRDILENRYSRTTFHSDKPITEYPNLPSIYLHPNHYVNITHDNEVISREEFIALSPLSTENILHIAISEFDWSQSELYIETDTQFMLYHWYTTA